MAKQRVIVGCDKLGIDVPVACHLELYVVCWKDSCWKTSASE